MGYTGPAMSGGKLFTMGARDATVFLVAIDCATGKEVWSKQIGVYYRNNWGDGPRGTDNRRRQGLRSWGTRQTGLCKDRRRCRCLKDLVKDLGGKVPGWGY